MFNLLAGEDNENIEGLVAYALYKRHKRQWANKIRAEQDREPTPAEEAGFATSISTDDQCERYRKDAQDILIGFANSFVEDQRPFIAKEAVAGELIEAAQTVKNSGSFWSLLKVGVVSTIVTSALLALLAFGTQFFGIDLVDALKGGSTGSTPPELPTKTD
ncbi:hypothetical protein [Leisingera sp. ANG-S]|nr:hypothetical protein [Leisingera sp. ANG-S]